MSYVPLPRTSQSSTHHLEHYVIVNGHRFPVGSGRYGQELISLAGGDVAGRRVVRLAGGWFERIDHTRLYSPEDLLDRSGNPIKIKSLPERSKGGFFDFILGRNERESQPVAEPQKSRQAEGRHKDQPAGQRTSQHTGQRSGQPGRQTAGRYPGSPAQHSGQHSQHPAYANSQRQPLCPGVFEGVRSELSRSIIRHQVEDISKNYFKGPVIFDEKNCDWCIFPKYRLPRGWAQETTSLMIMFPVNYPAQAPIGFYLDASLPLPIGFDYDVRQAASAAQLQGWRWHCCYVESWQPSPRNATTWKEGDSIWTYFLLIREALSLNR